ncbi:MAG: hypothetical protein IJI73_10380, partial [Kiritimatiellae bacterium]|nr:hypothetical protein [Kiritimatiellia bacterium]
WIAVCNNNELSDRAGSMKLPSPWGNGGNMTWPIVNNFKRTSDNGPGTYFCNTDQLFSLSHDGTVRVEKFDWYTTVTTNRQFTYGRR